jgi:hypothetical protein
VKIDRLPSSAEARAIANTVINGTWKTGFAHRRESAFHGLPVLR